MFIWTSLEVSSVYSVLVYLHTFLFGLIDEAKIEEQLSGTATESECHTSISWLFNLLKWIFILFL